LGTAEDAAIDPAGYSVELCGWKFSQQRYLSKTATSLYSGRPCGGCPVWSLNRQDFNGDIQDVPRHFQCLGKNACAFIDARAASQDSGAFLRDIESAKWRTAVAIVEHPAL
jgi:hypothetical protein